MVDKEENVMPSNAKKYSNGHMEGNPFMSVGNGTVFTLVWFLRTDSINRYCYPVCLSILIWSIIA